MYVVLLIIGAWFLYAAWKLVPSYSAGKEAVRVTTAYQNTDPALTKSMLVLGDSTAVGVGALAPELSTAGRLSKALQLQVENHAKSGAMVEDMKSQFDKASKSRYDIILLQVGANNVVYFRSLKDAAVSLEALLPELKKKSEMVVLLTAGDIGKAPLWPFPMRYLYTSRTQSLRDAFMEAAKKHEVRYLDLYSLPDPFLTDVPRYYAKDKLHLSGEGYAVWSEYILDLLNEGT